MDIKTTAHFLWLGDKPMPNLYSQCLFSFAKKHNGWKVNVWTWKDVIPLIDESKHKDNYYKISHSFVNKYNFIKYTILDKFGGWYIDLDIRWKSSLDVLMMDKCKNQPMPQLMIPVRQLPGTSRINLHMNDDMLLYAEPGLFGGVLDTAFSRENYDRTADYEPVGPVSLSKWLHHDTEYTRMYLFEDEIQKDGKYCHHFGGDVDSFS